MKLFAVLWIFIIFEMLVNQSNGKDTDPPQPTTEPYSPPLPIKSNEDARNAEVISSMIGVQKELYDKRK